MSSFPTFRSAAAFLTFAAFFLASTGCQVVPVETRGPASEAPVQANEDEPETEPEDDIDPEFSVKIDETTASLDVEADEENEATHHLPMHERAVLGWVEWICLEPEAVRMKAKLDSGAQTSSMNALNLRRFERDGEPWVSFEIIDPTSNETIAMERPIVRNVRIVRHEEEADRRPVVRMTVRLGEIYQEVDFSLIDRSNFVYQVLIGRNYLRGLAVIDSDETFLAGRPACGAEPGWIDPYDALGNEDALDDGQ